MSAAETWALIHPERQALISDVQNLTDAQWQTKSLCPDWTVRQAFAHVTSTEQMTPAKFLTNFAKAGFKFHEMSRRNIAAYDDVPNDELVATYAAHAGDTTAPPGPLVAMVGEAVVHGEDIRRPLGIHRDYPAETVKRAAEFYLTSNLLIGAKKRVGGLTLKPTDADWTLGSGPEVSGPAVSLLLAMTGRRQAIDDLSGEGVEELRSRG